jgi:hypothetical protein
MATSPAKKIITKSKPSTAPAKKRAAVTVKPAAAKSPAKKTSRLSTAPARSAVARVKPTPAAMTSTPVKPVPAAKSVKAIKSIKPAKPVKQLKPMMVAVVAKDKVKKAKLVRDSFTMPEAEYAALSLVKKACISAGFEVKKSQLLRIGLLLLSKTDVKSLKTLLDGLAPLKAGRPTKDK